MVNPGLAPAPHEARRLGPKHGFNTPQPPQGLRLFWEGPGQGPQEKQPRLVPAESCQDRLITEAISANSFELEQGWVQ
jgi:hypothetical protein